MLKEIDPPNPKEVYREILENVKKLYCIGKLVHSDLSEYNILMKGNYPVIIDLSAAVLRGHPLAEEFLRRDIANIARFFDEDADEAMRFVREC
jgi:RIO kinase 1